MRKSCLFVSPDVSVDGFCAQLRKTVTDILDELIPVKSRRARVGKCGKNWLSDEAVEAKRPRRKLERQWKVSGSENIRKAYRIACKSANKLIVSSHRAAMSHEIANAGRDSKKLWKAVNNILHKRRSETVTNSDICDKFAKFALDKLARLRDAVAQYLASRSHFTSVHSRPPSCILMKVNPASVEEVKKLLLQLPNKTSPLDFINTSILKGCADIFAPLLCHLANLSFNEGNFHVE